MQLLIVDDSKIERMILKEMLQSEGYAVQEAEHGKQALEMALLSCPDMIISDILMPVMDGFRLCRNIRADKKTCNIPFVFYTGTYTKAEDEDFAFKMGADRFLVKRMGWPDFFREIQNVIREKEMKGNVMPELSPKDEKEIYKLYNERLIKKLEDKVYELEQEVGWRKKLEKQLYDSQESLQMALDGARLGMWDWNVQADEVRFNQQWNTFFGYSPDESLPNVSTWDKLLHPDDRANTMAKLQANLKGETDLYESEYRLKSKSGEWHWFLAKGRVATRDETGKALRHVGTLININERVEARIALEESHAQMENQIEIRTADLLKANLQLKDEILLRNKIEAALRESEERFRMLAENAREVIYRMSLPDGIYEYMSPAIIEIFGYTPQECYQNPLIIRQMLHPDWVDSFDEKWMELFEGKMLPAYEFKIIHKSGEERWVQFRNVLIRDANENPIAIEGIGTDITKLKKAELALAKQNERLDELVAERTSKLQIVSEALGEEKERYQLIFNKAPVGIIHYDLNGVFTECNQQFAEIIGAPPEKLIGFNTLKDTKNESVLNAIKASLAGKTGHYEGEYSSVTAGRTTHVRAEYVPVFSDHHIVVGGICVAMDISDQVLSAEKLAASEEKYRTILEKIEDGYFEVDLTGNLIFFNNALCDILGYTASELKGKNYRSFMDAENAQKTFQTFNQVFETGKPLKGFDWGIVRKDGSGAYLDTSVSPIKDVDENITGFRGVTRDVSERRLMEKFLAESEERFRLIVESAPVGIFSYDKNGIIQACNQAYVDINGSSFGKLIGFNLLKNVTNKLVLNAIQKSLAGSKGHYEGEYVSVTGGRRSYIKADFVPVFSEDKSLAGGMSVVADITDRKRAAAELQKKDQKYKGIFNDSVTAIYVFDEEKHFTDSNKAGLALLGYSIEELLNMSISDVDADPVAVLKAHDHLLSGEKIINYEHRLKRKDGTIITVLNNSKPITITGEGVIGIQSTLIDITDRNLAEDKLRKSQKQLRELSAYLQTAIENERKSIAREIHDDLGQSLTAIKMDVVWQKSKISEERTELHIKAEDTIFLVDSAIQTVKRISAELRPGLLDDLGLSAAIEWQAKEYQKRSDINIDVTIEPEEIVLGEDLSISIFRVCQETLTNVVRHAGATEVQVHLTKNSQMLELEVTDNGCGISDQSIAKKNSFGLLGMRERVHAIGGKISISRIQKGGTKVAVTVPLGVIPTVPAYF